MQSPCFIIVRTEKPNKLKVLKVLKVRKAEFQKSFMDFSLYELYELCRFLILPKIEKNAFARNAQAILTNVEVRFCIVVWGRVNAILSARLPEA